MLHSAASFEIGSTESSVPTYHIQVPSEPPNGSGANQPSEIITTQVLTKQQSSSSCGGGANSGLSNRTRLSPTMTSTNGSGNGGMNGSTFSTSSFYTHSSSSLTSLHSMTLTEPASDSDSEESAGVTRNRLQANGGHGYQRSSRASSTDSSSSSPDDDDVDPCAPVTIGISTTPPSSKANSKTEATKRPSSTSPPLATVPLNPDQIRAISSSAITRASNTLEDGESSSQEFKPPASKAYHAYRPDTPPKPKPVPLKGFARVKAAVSNNFSRPSLHLGPIFAGCCYFLLLFVAFYLPHYLSSDSTFRSASGISPFGSLSIYLTPSPIYSPFLHPSQQNQLRLDVKNMKCSEWMESWWSGPGQLWKSSVLIHGAEPSMPTFGALHSIVGGNSQGRENGMTADGGVKSSSFFVHAAPLPQQQPVPIMPSAGAPGGSVMDQYPPMPSMMPQANSIPPLQQQQQQHQPGSIHEQFNQQLPHQDADYHHLAQQQFDAMQHQYDPHQQHHQQSRVQFDQYPSQFMQQHFDQPHQQHFDSHLPRAQHQQHYDPYAHEPHHQLNQPYYPQPPMHQPIWHDPLAAQQQFHPPHQPKHPGQMPSYDPYQQPYDAHTPSPMQQDASEYQKLLVQQHLLDQIQKEHEQYQASRVVPASIGEVEAKLKERVAKERAAATAEAEMKEKEKEKEKEQQQRPATTIPSEEKVDSMEPVVVLDSADATTVPSHPVESVSSPIVPPPPLDESSLSAMLKSRREREKEVRETLIESPAVTKEKAEPQSVVYSHTTIPASPHVAPQPTASMHSPPSHFASFRPFPLMFYIGCSTTLLFLPWMGLFIVVTNLIISLIILVKQWWSERQAILAAKLKATDSSNKESQAGLMAYLLNFFCGRCRKKRSGGSSVHSLAPPVRPLPTVAVTHHGTVSEYLLSNPHTSAFWHQWARPFAICCLGGFPAYLWERACLEKEKRGKKGL